MRASQAFFALPLESKLSYSRGVKKIQGYSSFGREVLENDDIIEAKESFDIHCLDEDTAASEELKIEAKTFPDKEVPELRPKGKNLATQARHKNRKDAAHKGNLMNRTFVTLKWKYFPKPLHMLINWTNQIASFYQPMRSDKSDCLFLSD